MAAPQVKCTKTFSSVDHKPAYPGEPTQAQNVDRASTIEREQGYIYRKTPPITDCYTIKKQIGNKGGFGTCYLAKERNSGRRVAVKVINKSHFLKYPPDERQGYYDDLACEIDIMRRVYEDEAKVFIVMELCRGGEVLERILKIRSFSEEQAAHILKQMISSLSYLHRHQVAHCDIKPDNFLFVDDSEKSVVKLIDFGLAKILRKREYLKHTAGTAYYMSPEVLRGHYNQEADMWSIGAVMFVMLFGFPPFYVDPAECGGEDEDDMIFDLIDRGFYPEVRRGYGPWFPASMPISKEAMDLMGKLLRKNVASRITADEALQHPWLSGKAPATVLSPDLIKSLRTYRNGTHFRAVLLALFSDTLEDHHVDAITCAFREIDKEGNGVLTGQKLRDTIHRMLIDEKDPEVHAGLQRILRAADSSDVALSRLRYEDILLAAVHRRLVSKEERMYEAFQRLDSHGTGVISPEDLIKVLDQYRLTVHVTPQELKNFFEQMGQDGIDYDGFVRMWHEDTQSTLMSMRDNSFLPQAPLGSQVSVRVGTILRQGSVNAPSASKKQEERERIRAKRMFVQWLHLFFIVFFSVFDSLCDVGVGIMWYLNGETSWAIWILVFVASRTIALIVVDQYLLAWAYKFQIRRGSQRTEAVMGPKLHPIWFTTLLSLLQVRISFEAYAQPRTRSRLPLPTRKYVRYLQLANLIFGSIPLLFVECYALSENIDSIYGLIVISIAFATLSIIVCISSLEDPVLTILGLMTQLFFHSSEFVFRALTLVLFFIRFVSVPFLLGFLWIDWAIGFLIILNFQDKPFERAYRALKVSAFLFLGTPVDSLQNWSTRALHFMFLWKLFSILLIFISLMIVEYSLLYISIAAISIMLSLMSYGCLFLHDIW